MLGVFGDAGRKQGLSWWNTEFQQNQQDAMDGIVTWLDPADQVGFTGRITAVGNVPAGRSRGPAERGEAYLEIVIIGFENGNTAETVFTNNTVDWLQSDGTDIGGVPEDDNDYFYLAGGIDTADDWLARFRTEAEQSILHQNFAYVGRVGPNGAATFNPRQVPVIWEANTVYHQGQLLWNNGIQFVVDIPGTETQYTSGADFATTAIIDGTSQTVLTSFSVGTNVAANPVVTDTNPALSSITIGTTDYRVAGAGGIDDTDIAPSSVRIGGTLGTHVLRERVTGISAGAQVGDAVDNVSVTIDSSANIVHATTFPAGLVDRTDYVFRVTGAVTGLAEGDYLAEYRENAFAGGDIWFDFRPITAGVAGTDINFTTGGTFTGFGYTVFQMATGTRGLQILDTSTDPDEVLLMDTTGGNVEFPVVPTSNSLPLVVTQTIQRITTDLPLQTEPIPQDTSIVYHLAIYSSIELSSNISVQFLGAPVGNLTNVNIPNPHLSIGENTFTFTLSDNQVRAWNANVHSPNIDFEGFEVRNNSGTALNSIRSTNQFFLGGADDNSAGVQQNHQAIVDIQHRDDDFEHRIEILERASIGSVHLDTYAWRDVSTLPIQDVTIDEIITYTERGTTNQIDFRTVISTAGTGRVETSLQA